MLREPFGVLVQTLKRHGYSREAESIAEFAASNKRVLSMLEDAYITSRYGEVGYDASDVNEALSTAKKLIVLLEEVSRSVKLG